MANIDDSKYILQLMAVDAKYTSIKDKNVKNIDKYAEQKLEAVKFSIRGEGEIDGGNINPVDIVQLGGIGNMFAGNWFVTEVTTKLDSKGYTTNFSCVRDFIYTGVEGEKKDKQVKSLAVATKKTASSNKAVKTVDVYEWDSTLKGGSYKIRKVPVQ